jgi:formylglycine-generating enzyme required for sulfatase activity
VWLDDVAVGYYWATAYDPRTGAFVEGPRTIAAAPPPGAPRPEPLVFRARTDAEATAGMRLVRGGPLAMGRDDVAPKQPEYPRHRVDVADVYLDPYEVTNRQLDEYLTASGRNAWRPLVWPPTGRPARDRLDWPAVNAPPQLAQEFCRWSGCRLPSEEELEWAARGPAGRLAPPADAPPADDRRWLDLHPVGASPADRVETPSGPLFDLFGNAGEITLFRYRPYPGSPPTHVRDPWFGFVVRCGLFWGVDNKPVLLGSTGRVWLPQNQRNALIGFRRARTPRRPLLFSYLQLPRNRKEERPPRDPRPSTAKPGRAPRQCRPGRPPLNCYNRRWRERPPAGSSRTIDEPLRMIKRTPDGISPDDRSRLREAPWGKLRPGVEVREIDCDGYRVTERRYRCQECGGDEPQGFRVTDELWRQVCSEGGIICLPCIEARLGRPIKSTDFRRDVPINSILLLLLDRLEAFPGGAIRPVDLMAQEPGKPRDSGSG